MERLELVNALNQLLLEDLPQYKQEAKGLPTDLSSRRRLLRSLLNLRPPMPFTRGFLALQGQLLSAEREERGVVDGEMLPSIAHPHLALWQGDITRLKADAIVNAANSSLLGCFCPCHGCIDNAIHSAAGLELRQECHRMMEAQGHPEPVGRVKSTGAYHLPSQWVFHTVGPLVQGTLLEIHRQQLASCYRACLELATEMGLSSLAFCCISNGEFHFPPKEAAAIALSTVREFLSSQAAPSSPTVNEAHPLKIIFNAFTPQDALLYRTLLEASTG